MALARGLSRLGTDQLSPADWVTLARASLAVGVAALVADSFEHPAHVTLLVTLAVVALVLDRVDGWVVRRTGKASPLGGHFDAEVDAFLILVLSVYVARSLGAWVLAIGLARYAFLAAGWLLPWMRETLPPRYWRKVVAATQGIVLTITAADVVPQALAEVAVAAALALLAESFGRDVWWLWSHRQATHHPADTTAVQRRQARTGAPRNHRRAHDPRPSRRLVRPGHAGPAEPAHAGRVRAGPARGPPPRRAGRRPAAQGPTASSPASSARSSVS